MLDIGGWEFLVVAFVLIMVVGPKELPRMLRSFTSFTKQMRKMGREFTDGMHQLAADADVADLKATMDKAKSGNLDELASAIDPGGSVSDQVRELGDSVKAAADDDVSMIGDMANEAGEAIAAESRGSDDKPAAKTKASTKASTKKKS